MGRSRGSGSPSPPPSPTSSTRSSRLSVIAPVALYQVPTSPDLRSRASGERDRRVDRSPASCANATGRCRLILIGAGLIPEREQNAMSTIANPPRPEKAPRQPMAAVTDFGDQRIVIRGVGRHVYDVLDEAIGEGQHIRLAYDGKDLELLTTSDLHEYYKELFGKFVSAVTFTLDIDHIASGEKTWRTEDTERGPQADLSYYFEPEKLRIARDGLKRKSMDLADFPSAPDLAIEIDASRPMVDRP